MPGSIFITVSCYAGYRADERPESFTLGERTLGVEEVLGRWDGPDYRYFKVRASDGNTYILRHDEIHDAWELEFFRAEG
jgi:hypothetical protein